MGEHPSVEARRPTYVRIAEILRASLEAGSIPPGAVLLEGPLATLFRSGRSPVKQALSGLERDGLLRRFGGRGLVAGQGASPARIVITPEMLVSSHEEIERLHADPVDPLYYRVERELILHSLFGRFRVNELALARHHGIGRATAGDILRRAQQVGLVVKDGTSRWSLVPLDHDRFRDLYELRRLLEPAALASATDRIPSPVLDEIADRHHRAVASYPDIGVAELDRLEEDLHVTCIGYAANRDIVEALKRCRTILVSGKHIQMAMRDRPPVDPFMIEHLAVIDALRRADASAAAEALTRHLEASGRKALDRLVRFHAANTVVPIDYIVR